MKASWLFWSLFGYFCLLFFSILHTTVFAIGLPLNDFITHFEPVYYDQQQLRRTHQRSKRSSNGLLALQLIASNRIFNMKLKKDESIFADDAIFESNEGPVKYDVSRVFQGHLEDDADSLVQGIVTSDGYFDGSVTMSTGTEYIIEPARRYLETSSEFHSVIYKSTDVKMISENVTCFSELLSQRCCRHKKRIKKKKRKKSVRRSLEKDRNNIHDDNNNYYYQDAVGAKSNADMRASSDAMVVDGSGIANLSVIPADHLEAFSKYFSVYGQTKRRISSRFISNESRFLNSIRFSGDSREQETVISKSDYLEKSIHHFSSNVSDYWRLRKQLTKKLAKVKEEEASDRERLSMPYDYELRFSANNPVSNRLQMSETFQKKRAVIDPKKTTCMLYLQADHLFYLKMGSIDACIETMTRHVQKVNNIYKVTDFDQDGRLDNISFMIKRIKVHTDESLKDSSYRFPGNYGVEKFLELFSEEDYDAFCLAYMFTYRDFEGGTLGLAWTGDLKNAGGVCEKNGHYRGSLKSLNTGIVTLLNYGKHVPPAVSHVTLAHEIGHNFGSPHDPEENLACTPGGDDGNYIMFARATSGDKRNNNKFSPCSLRSINAVLNTKARGNKGCFTEPQDSICGNEVVEKGESCDCGWEEDCKESCCFPMRTNPPKDEPPCRLRQNKTCSPSQGPCCSQQCKLRFGTKCRDDNGCRDASFCDGGGPECPPSSNKPNKTICSEGFVCYMGECTGSICIAYGLEPCQCRREKGDPVTKACELCCKLRGEDQPCRSSFSWNSTPYEIPGMYAKPGTPCDNYNGYCDMFQKCREIDPSGPLATLRKLLLSTESIASLKRWIIDNWWGVVFIAVGFIIVLVVTVKVFGKSPDLKMKVANVSGQFPGSNNLAFPSAPQHAITTTTSIGRTNYPVTSAAANMANGYHHFSGTPNGWV